MPSEEWKLEAANYGWGPIRERDAYISRLEDERRAYWNELEQERERHNALIKRLREETDKRPMLLPGSPKLIDELVAHLDKAEAKYASAIGKVHELHQLLEQKEDTEMSQRNIGASLMAKQIRKSIEQGCGRFSNDDANWILDAFSKCRGNSRKDD